MKRKYINLIIIILFNIFALPLFIIDIIYFFNNSSLLYMFDEVGDGAVLKSFVLAIIFEGVMLLVLSIVNRKIILFLYDLILAPIALFIFGLGVFDYTETYKIELKDYNETIVVGSTHGMHHSNAILFERTSPISVKYICEIKGISKFDFQDTKYYSIDEYENGIIVTYAYSDGELYLKYENNHFYKVENKEEIINSLE